MRATLHLGLRGLRAHKRRLLGTFLAVVLGVSFLAGTMVLGDTLKSNFGTLFANAYAGTDAVVRGAGSIKADAGPAGVRAPITASLDQRVAVLPGVAAVAPSVSGAGQLVGADGKPIGGKGPPTTAGNWVTDPALNPYHLVQGRAPSAPGEAVINRGAARSGGLKVGDTTVLRAPDPVRVTIVGIAAFGSADGMGPSTFTGLTLADAQRYLLPRAGEVSTLLVKAAPGTSQEQLVRTIDTVLPAQDEAVTGAQAAQEDTTNVSSGFLSVFTTVLLVFAGIALLVATFTIHNTFAIVVAQRTRENALLRALGAARRQILGATLAEAVAVGLTASLAGLLGGIGVATGLKGLFSAIGMDLPTGGMVVTTSAVLVPVLVGTVVAIASALLPAIRAGRTAPVAAMRETAVEAVGGSRIRTVLGAVAGLAAAALTVLGATRGPSVALTAVGSVLALAAMIVLGPAAASLAVRVLGAPLPRLRGVSGALAARNAARNPRRTAATATALMVGVAVVSLFTVFGASIKQSLDDTVNRSFAGDLAISAPSFGAGGSGLSPRIAPAVAALPQVRNVVALGSGVAAVDGHAVKLDVTDPKALTGTVTLGATQGAVAGLGADGIAVSRAVADRYGWTVGQALPVAYADGSHQSLTLDAVYTDAGVVGDYLVTPQTWAPHRTQDSDTLVAVSLKQGVPLAAGRTAVEQAVAGFGGPTVQDRAQFATSAAAGIDMMLSVVYALLALAVLIALMGIANTLTLAMHERTRELGLLRGVGQTRAQLRSMVRWESVLVAVFGTVGGLGLGAFLGWALVRATDSTRTGSFALPVPQLVVVLAVGMLAGALAAVRPARRAARLEVLRAIAAP
ncbi:ABC transporter permease [Streptacidiphilus carbonis]|uniref:ABC transporter permease n=1 Tax=Streptacidiphilus carbonis TaxID=105422 RepID=UPI0005A90847|nr:ABC transporter permease [Streptacidiphilus carbonis]